MKACLRLKAGPKGRMGKAKHQWAGSKQVGQVRFRGGEGREKQSIMLLSLLLLNTKRFKVQLRAVGQ